MYRLLVSLVLLATAAQAVPWPTRCSDCERDSHGRIKRSRAAVKAFKRDHPLPAALRRRKRNKVDHLVPLACGIALGGLDRPENMQWQSEKDAADKDTWEMWLCGMTADQARRITSPWQIPAYRLAFAEPDPAPLTPP